MNNASNTFMIQFIFVLSDEQCSAELDQRSTLSSLLFKTLLCVEITVLRCYASLSKYICLLKMECVN